MRRKWNVIAVVLCAAILTCACAAQTDENTKDKATVKAAPKEKEYQASLNMIEPRAYGNVNGLNLEKGAYLSIIGKSTDGEYWEAVKKGVEQAAKDINETLGYEGKDKVKVNYSGPSNADDVDEQVNILDEELARYPSAVAIAIADVKACEVQFDLAAEGDIPVVAFDSGSDYQGLLATVATDNADTAKVAAAKLAEEIKDEGQIALFVHDSKTKAAAERESAFLEEIQNNHPNISVVNVYHMDKLSDMQKIIADEINAGTYNKNGEANMNPAGSGDAGVAPESISEADVVDYIFAKNPDIKGCYATNSDAVTLILAGLARLEKKDMKVVGYDASKEELKALKDGKIDGLIVQNPFGMGYAAVVAASRAALKQGNEASVNSGYTWVTKDNLTDENVKKILY